MLRRLQHPPATRPRAGRGWVATLTMAAALVACSSQGTTPPPKPDPDQPDATAAALAAGLAARDLTAVPFSGSTGAQAQAALGPLVEGMGSLRPAVTVKAVQEQGETADATLGFSWTFPGVAQKWAYESTARLVQEGSEWKATWAPGIVQPGLDGTNRLSERRNAAARGEILGEDGDAIVKLRPVVRIGIDKTKVSADKAASSASRLAELVDIDPKGYVSRVEEAGRQDFVEAITFRADAKGLPTNKEVYAIAGAVPLAREQMLPPTREFARALLGTVGAASKEIVDSSRGAVTAGDEVGRSGLQRRYDERLRGRPGVVVRLVAAKPSSSASPSPTPSATATPTAPSATLFEAKPVPGEDLTTSLSIPLQDLAEETLADTKPASALVALRPSTGEVLVVANGPGSKELPVATTGQYPPGSTFKVASSLALLRAGSTPSSPVTCPPSLTVDGKKFTNYSDYPSSGLGDIDLETALAQSCNTAFIGQRGKLSGNQLAKAAASLGVGTDYDVGFPSYFGQVPQDKTTTGRAAAMIGQGKVLASPLAMASVAASVQAGKTVLPTLVEGTRATSKAEPLTRDEADDLRTMMRAVVTQGSGRALSGLDGPAVIAKTGTAEFGPREPYDLHAWMIAAQGDLAVAVFVDKGSSGSKTAGPLLADFLSGAR